MDACRNGCRRSVLWTGGSAAAAEAGADISVHLLACVAACEARLRSRRALLFHSLLAPLVPHALLSRLDDTPNPLLVCAHATGLLIRRALEKGHLTELAALEVDSCVADMLRAGGEARRGFTMCHRSIPQMLDARPVLHCFCAHTRRPFQCESVARTPAPPIFSAHTSRFLTMFCFTLPLVLAPRMGIAAIPAASLVAYSLLAIDEIACLLEAPFNGYLPIKQLFAQLREDVLALVAEAGAPWRAIGGGGNGHGGGGGGGRAGHNGGRGGEAHAQHEVWGWGARNTARIS